MVIASGERLREFLCARLCAGVYFPPPTLLIARGALDEPVTESFAPFRSAQLHLLRASTFLRAAFNVLTANGLPSRAVS